MMKNTGSWILAIAVVLCLIGYFGWTVSSGQPSALNAQLHPIAVIKAIAAQATQASYLSEWNLPFRGFLSWFMWIVGVHGCGVFVVGLVSSRAFTAHAAAAGVISFAIGFVLFAMVQLLAGVVGIANFPLISLFFILALGALLYRPYRLNLQKLPNAVWWQWLCLGRGGRAVLLVLLFLIALLLIPAMTPPAQSDGLRYHLGAVQEYLKAGRITYLPLNAYSNMPFLIEMHFMAALTCRAPEATQFMHMTLALYTVLGIYALLLRLSPAVPAPSASRLIYLLTALLYIGTPMSAVLATWPFTDHGIAFFLVTSVLAALACIGWNSCICGWILTGIAAGGLVGTKYTMAPVAIAVISLPFLMDRISGKQVRVRGLVVGMVVMGIIGGIWYLKNLVLTGNPFYPLGSRLFPGGEWTAANDAFLQERAGAKGMGKGLLELLILPWNSTFHWLRFEAHHPGATVLLAALSAVFGLTLTADPQLNSERRSVFVIVLITYVIWFFSYQSNRLLLPTIALALSLTPWYLFSAHRATALLYAGTVSVAAAVGLAWAVQWSWVTTALTPPPLPYIVGAQDVRTYRYQAVTNARAFDFLNEQVRPDEKVLLIGEHRIYGAWFDALWSDWFDTPALVHLLRKEKLETTEQVLDYLRHNNIRWIMINERELVPQLDRDFRPWFTPQEWQIFKELRVLNAPKVKTYHLPPGVTIHHLTNSVH